jgi:hypothetical protein
MPLPEKLSPRWRRAFDWVEATLGGPVVHAERDPEILRLLHRRTLRRLALLRSAMREDPDATIQKLS